MIESSDESELLVLLDSVVQNVDNRKVEPAFSNEVSRRIARYENAPTTDSDLLREMASLIAYSQNARSDLVSSMLEQGTFEQMFVRFDVHAVANLDSSKIKENYWSKVGVIRFPKKLAAVINCAKALNRIARSHSSFRGLLLDAGIPVEVKTDDDVAQFWKGFNSLRRTLEESETPFFANDVSLLHLLLHLGYDCLKPDMVVMRVAKDIGVIQNEKSGSEKRKVVRLAQVYGVSRRMKPAVLDLYLLAFGGQEWARQFVRMGQ